VLVITLLFYLRKSTILNWLLLSLSIISFTPSSKPSLIKFLNVENNVSYSKVTALPFNQADEQISYGSDPLQYALLWRAKKGNKVKKLENKLQTPLVILIHGGCWLSAYDIQHTYALSTGLSNAGFNVSS